MNACFVFLPMQVCFSILPIECLQYCQMGGAKLGHTVICVNGFWGPLCRCNATAAFDDLSDGSYVFRARKAGVSSQDSNAYGVSVFSIDSVPPVVEVRTQCGQMWPSLQAVFFLTTSSLHVTRKE